VLQIELHRARWTRINSSVCLDGWSV